MNRHGNERNHRGHRVIAWINYQGTKQHQAHQ